MVNQQLDLSEYKPVNFLWNKLCTEIGKDRALKAICQANDVLNMTAREEVLPVLFLETCGVALVNIQLIRKQTGLCIHGNKQILIVSNKTGSFQLIQNS